MTTLANERQSQPRFGCRTNVLQVPEPLTRNGGKEWHFPLNFQPSRKAWMNQEAAQAYMIGTVEYCGSQRVALVVSSGPSQHGVARNKS
jgi:hypothetical protein